MKFFNFFIITLVISTSNLLLAQDRTYIPDNNFEQALINFGYDNVLDDYVNTNNIRSITTLDIKFNNISDLTGIEDFIQLINLNCSFNSLITLDVSENSALQNLDCGFNYLSSLDLSTNTNLEILYCDYNNLENLNLKNGNNTNIVTFNAIGNTNLTCIDVDNIAYSQSNWTNKDAQVTYSIDCSNVSVNQTYVPDNNFEQALIDLGYDNVLDDYVATSNISSVSILNISDKGISNLKGIEDFTGLTELYCGLNSLDILDLSSNTNLTYLNCYFNNLTTLDLSDNINLSVLICYLNNISSLDLSNNTALTILSCANNNLESLNLRNGNNTNIVTFNVADNPVLTCIDVDNVAYSQSNWTNKDEQTTFSLDCSNVSIEQTYIPDTNFEQALIDLGYDDVIDDHVATSNINNVSILNISDRDISDLTGIEDFTGLTELYCGLNNLDTLDLSTNINLTYLNCYFNNLTSLDLSNNINLEVFTCYLNNLNNLDLSNNTALTMLSCANNNLESLNLRNNNNTNIVTFNAVNNPNLTCIDVDNVAYSQSNWTNKDAQTIYSLDCSSVSAERTFVPDNNFEQALIDLGYDDVIDDYVTTSNISSVSILNVSNKSISDLTGIEDFTGLTELYCGLNNLDTLNLNSNTNLIYLNCYFNNLTSLDLSNNTNLEILTCYLNSLNSLDLSNNSALTILSCANNNLESINLRNGNNTNITTFSVTNNPALTCVDVDNVAYSQSNWTNKDAQTIYSLDCSSVSAERTFVPDNNFEQALIDLGYDDVVDGYVTTSNISSVSILNVSNKGISDLTGIEDFVGLTDLFCGSNNLNDLDLSNNTNLIYLNCHFNNLTSLDLSNNVNLEVLTCYLNDLTSLDLSNNSALIILNCANTSLYNLNLKNGNNTNITNINIANNPNLICIEVDDVEYSKLNWTNRDAQAVFSIYCTQISNKSEIVNNNNKISTSGTEQSNKNGYIIYPNPVRDVLNIKLNNGFSLIQANVYNALGQHILSTKQNSINVSHIQNGIYLLEVQTNIDKSIEKIIFK